MVSPRLKRAVGQVGAIAWMGGFLALAVGHAHGDEWAAALAHLATALSPTPAPLPPPGFAPSGSAAGTPVALFLVLAGLLLGGGALCVWLGGRARPNGLEDTD